MSANVARAGRSGKVLILSPHVMTAALVGWYVELTKLEPAFLAPGEPPDEAIARVRPLLVLLVDAEQCDAISDIIAARAAKRGAGIAVFSGRPDDHEAREWAAQRGVPFFRIPIDLEAFARMLDRAARRSSVGAGERSSATPAPATERALDGTLILRDGDGALWYVYDRRAGRRDRRQPAAAVLMSGEGVSAEAYRSFVNWDGVERRVQIRREDEKNRDPETLIAQLARAVPV